MPRITKFQTTKLTDFAISTRPDNFKIHVDSAKRNIFESLIRERFSNIVAHFVAQRISKQLLQRRTFFLLVNF